MAASEATGSGRLRGGQPARISSAGAVDAVAAGAVVFFLPMQAVHFFSRSLGLGVILAALLIPLTLGGLRVSREARRLCLLLAMCIGGGLLLTEVSQSSGLSANRAYGFAIVLVLVAGGLALAAVAWARTLLSIPIIAGLYAAGACTNGVVDHELWQNNAWKYAFGWPVIVLVLAMTARRARITQILSLTVLGAISVSYDDRNLLGICAVCALVVAVNAMRARQPSSRSPRQIFAAIVLLSLVGFGAYQGASYLAVSGALGEKTQARTAHSIQVGGSLLAGGRPEAFASIVLFEHRPLGLGLGVFPDADSLLDAKAALDDHGTPYNSLHVVDYMFSDHVELHSEIADLWAEFGLFGIILAGYILLILLRGTAAHITDSTPLLLFLGIGSLWDMVYSPLPEAFSPTMLTVSLLVSFDAFRSTALANWLG